MTKIIISGASGFVGKNLKPYLEKHKYMAHTLSRRQNDEHYSYGNTDANYLNSFTTFIHLAGKAHDLKKTSDDGEYFEVNTELTKRMFNTFLKSTSTNFIFLSSVKAAADSVKGILIEDIIPNPQTPYGKSKLAAENYLLAQKLPNDKRLYILRPCMIHGPNNKGNLNLLYKLVKKRIPYPLGAYNNKRSFLAVDNLCDIIHKLMIQCPDSGIYNVADDYALSTVEVTECISNVLHKKPRIWTVPKPFIEILATLGTLLKLPLTNERLLKLTENYEVSNSKIKTALKINTTFDTKEGLLKTIESFNK